MSVHPNDPSSVARLRRLLWPILDVVLPVAAALAWTAATAVALKLWFAP